MFRRTLDRFYGPPPPIPIRIEYRINGRPVLGDECRATTVRPSTLPELRAAFISRWPQLDHSPLGLFVLTESVVEEGEEGEGKEEDNPPITEEGYATLPELKRKNQLFFVNVGMLEVNILEKKKVNTRSTPVPASNGSAAGGVGGKAGKGAKRGRKSKKAPVVVVEEESEDDYDPDDEEGQLILELDCGDRCILVFIPDAGQGALVSSVKSELLSFPFISKHYPPSSSRGGGSGSATKKMSLWWGKKELEDEDDLAGYGLASGDMISLRKKEVAKVAAAVGGKRKREDLLLGVNGVGTDDELEEDSEGPSRKK